jgi:hypothetical protein
MNAVAPSKTPTEPESTTFRKDLATEVVPPA